MGATDTAVSFPAHGPGDAPEIFGGDAARSLQALDVEAADAAREHYFPEHVDLGPDSRIKRFVAFDGSPAFTPARLTYVDGTQALVIHLRGTWVGA